VPYLVDSPVVSNTYRAERWKTLAGCRLVYADPQDEALWIFHPDASHFAIPHTPNLGNASGRLVAVVFVLLIAAMVAGLVYSQGSAIPASS